MKLAAIIEDAWAELSADQDSVPVAHLAEHIATSADDRQLRTLLQEALALAIPVYFEELREAAADRPDFP
jgi:hypothetical protein